MRILADNRIEFHPLRNTPRLIDEDQLKTRKLNQNAPVIVHLHKEDRGMMDQTMNTTNSYREKLLTRKEELTARLEKVEDLLDDPKSQSFSEQATEREFDEVYEAQGMASEQELLAIDAALNRISNGTYGKCLTCSEPISAERLAAVPFATKCRKCMQ